MTSIRDIRKRLALTQAQMAALLGCSQGNVSFYEHGQVMPPEIAKRLIRAAAGLGVALSYDDIYGSAFGNEPSHHCSPVREGDERSMHATCQVHAPHPEANGAPAPTPEGVPATPACSGAAA